MLHSPQLNGVWQTLVRSISTLVANGSAELHFVNIPFLKAFTEQAGWRVREITDGSVAARGEVGEDQGYWEGSSWRACSEIPECMKGLCYIHGYSCLPDVSDEALEFAQEVGCWMIPRPHGFELVEESMVIALGDQESGVRVHTLLLKRSNINLFFPDGIGSWLPGVGWCAGLVVHWGYVSGRTNMWHMSVWPANWSLAVTVTDLQIEPSIPLPLYPHFEPWEELFQKTVECFPLEETVDINAGVRMSCSATLWLPMSMFSLALGRRRLTLTFSVPALREENFLRLEEAQGARLQLSSGTDFEVVSTWSTRVVDCFMFNQELDMLQLRLVNHEDFVDWFVIIESPTTLSGHKKPLVFDINKHDTRFRKFRHKIIHRVVALPFDDPQENEGHARHECYRVIPVLNLTKDDLILVSDLDEIVDSERFLDQVAMPLFESWAKGQNKNHREPWCLKMSLHYYNWMCRAVGPGAIWARTVLYLVEYLLYYMPKVWKHIPGVCRQTFQYSKEVVGWHASYFFDEKGIENKLRSFGHAHEDSTVQVLENKDEWKYLIVQCVDLFANRTLHMQSTPLEQQRLPIRHSLVGYIPKSPVRTKIAPALDPHLESPVLPTEDNRHEHG